MSSPFCKRILLPFPGLLWHSTILPKTVGRRLFFLDRGWVPCYNSGNAAQRKSARALRLAAFRQGVFSEHFELKGDRYD